MNLIWSPPHQNFSACRRQGVSVPQGWDIFWGRGDIPTASEDRKQLGKSNASFWELRLEKREKLAACFGWRCQRSTAVAGVEKRWVMKGERGLRRLWPEGGRRRVVRWGPETAEVERGTAELVREAPRDGALRSPSRLRTSINNWNGIVLYRLTAHINLHHTVLKKDKHIFQTRGNYRISEVYCMQDYHYYYYLNSKLIMQRVFSTTLSNITHWKLIIFMLFCRVLQHYTQQITG